MVQRQKRFANRVLTVQAGAALALLPLSLAQAQLKVQPDEEPQRVFAGEARSISFRLHNSGEQPVSATLRAHLFQASSATALPLGEQPGKRLEVLPGQTVLDSVTLSFPAVRAETRFVIKWLEGTNHLVGTTQVLVYPTDVLKELKALGGGEPLGILDPSGELKPLLKAAEVEYTDLAEAGLEDYRGQLAILGPFPSQTQMPEALPERIKALVQRGVAVLWLQPPPQARATLQPSFYALGEGQGAAVIAQAHLVARLAESPQSQLNLVALARAARHPPTYTLSGLTPSP